MIPGAPAADAPVVGPAGRSGSSTTSGTGFTLLTFGDAVGPFGVASLAREHDPPARSCRWAASRTAGSGR